MLPIISTKKPTEGRRPAVAAIISGEKKSKTKKRPRAVLPPKSKAAANINSNTSSTNNVETLLAGSDITGIDWQQQRVQQHCNNNDDENSLVLAAEAAAALIMGSDSVAAAGPTIFQATSSSSITPRNGTNNDGVLTNRNSLQLLENVVASVKVVQDDNDVGKGGIAWGGGEHDSDNYHHYQNPLGPSSHVQIFESKVPTTMLTSSSSLLEMSEKHREFLAQYYGNGGAEQHADDFLRNDEDEDEEIIEEDVDVAESGRNHTNNIPNKKMSAQVTESSSSSSGGMMATTTTLRAMCKKIPRSTSNKKPKKSNDNQKKGVTFHEGDDVVHLLKADEEDNNVVDGDASTAASTSLSVEDPSGPQVTVDEHGTIVIAQNSLLPNPENRRSTTEIDQELLGGGSVIDEGETPSQLGAIQARYDSYMAVPRTVPVRWSVRETKDFYNALRQCGTDFSLMQMYCLGRTRAQLKRKFKIESRKNARLVDMALDPKCHVKLDISVFGDSLEIPEEVPTFVREVTPTLPASGGAASSTGSGLAVDSNDHHVRGNYDHLFEEEDEALALGENYTSSTVGATGVAMDSTTLTPGDMFASKSKSNQGRDSLQQPLTILPVVVAAPKMMAKKKMRFKVKPPKKSVK